MDIYSCICIAYLIPSSLNNQPWISEFLLPHTKECQGTEGKLMKKHKLHESVSLRTGWLIHPYNLSPPL